MTDDGPVQVGNSKLLLDEQEREVRGGDRAVSGAPAPAREGAVPSWRRWLLSLDVDGLVAVFQDPEAGGSWNDALRAEVLELIRAKGGDQAVRRAIGLHFDRPASRAGRPAGDEDGGDAATGAGRGAPRLWRGTAVAEPGQRRAIERVGRAFVEAALRWALDKASAEAAPGDPRRHATPDPPVDLTARMAAAWPELAPPPLAAGAPGVDLDLLGARLAHDPAGLLRQHLHAVRAVIEAAGGAAAAVHGRVERSDGSTEWFHRAAAPGAGLPADAAERAITLVTAPGVAAGRLRLLAVLLRPGLAYHDGRTGAVWAGPCPAAAPPDPVRPGPLWFELLLPSPAPVLTWRVHVGPEAAAGVTGVLNAPRVMAILADVSARGFLPAVDTAARLAPPAPVVGREERGGAHVVYTRRPGDGLACATVTGPLHALEATRAALAAAGGDDAVRAAVLTAPDGPVPSLPP